MRITYEHESLQEITHRQPKHLFTPLTITIIKDEITIQQNKLY